VRLQCLAHEGGAGDAVGPQHHQRERPLQDSVQRRGVAHGRAELNLHACIVGDARGQIEKGGRAATQAIQVVDIEVTRAKIDEAARHRERVVGMGPATRRVALPQPHDLAVEDIDGGDNQHAVINPRSDCVRRPRVYRRQTG